MPVGRPISVRFEREVDRQVRGLARRTRRPLGRVINELIDHALRMRRFPGIVFVEGPMGPVAHVAGTGLDVWEIVALVRAYGSVDRVLEAFPHLPAPAVHTALAYAEEYREEIEEAIRENERPVEEVLREYPFIRKVHV
jgi:uncharacterized protein (DUF433 family)